MKQKLKLYLRFSKIAFLCLIYYNCQDYDKDQHFMSHQHSKNPYEISFDDFKNETRINNVKKFVSSKFQAASTKSLNDSLFYDFDDFHFFEAPIYSFTGDNGNTSYSFYLEEINQTNDYQIYNLVIHKDDNDDWETNIYRLTEDIDDTNLETYSTIEHILSSNGLPAFMKGWEGQWVEQTEYHCVGCVGECDLCSDCITTTWTYQLVYTIDVGNSGGGGSGSDSGNTNDGGGDASQKGFATVTDPCDSSSNGFTNSSGCNFQDNDDCEKIKNTLNKSIGNGSKIQNVVQVLNNFDDENFEVAISIDSQNAVTIEQGVEGESSVDFNTNPNNPYLVFAHTHDAFGINGSGTLSVFSFDDLKHIAKTIHNGKTDQDFVAFLVTSKGTRYAMTINNPIKYLDLFYRFNVEYPSTANQINKWIESRNLINPLILEYFDRDNPNRKIKETEPNNETTLRHFLKFLDDADAGVKLFEANQDFSNFQPLRLNYSGFVDRNLVPCNILNQN